MPVDDRFSKPDVTPGASKPRRRKTDVPPYRDWALVPGRPGWYEDGQGHKKYDGLPDAMKRDREATRNK